MWESTLFFAGRAAVPIFRGFRCANGNLLKINKYLKSSTLLLKWCLNQRGCLVAPPAPIHLAPRKDGPGKGVHVCCSSCWIASKLVKYLSKCCHLQPLNTITASLPLKNRPKRPPKRKGSSEPTINFQGQRCHT